MRDRREQVAGIDELLIRELIDFFQRFNDFHQRLSDLNCAERQRIRPAIEREDARCFRIPYTRDANSSPVSKLNQSKAEIEGRSTVIHNQLGFHKSNWVSNPFP